MGDPPSSRLMKRPGSFNVGQCSRCSRRCPHRRVALRFVAEIANWLPEVNISTHTPTSHSEYFVIRSDTLINKLVSVRADGVIFRERRGPLDPVQHQYWSFDQVSFVIQWKKIADGEIVYVPSHLWYPYALLLGLCDHSLMILSRLLRGQTHSSTSHSTSAWADVRPLSRSKIFY